MPIGKPLSVTTSSRFGFSGSEMSKMIPLPEQAPAASLRGEHRDVVALVGFARFLRAVTVMAAQPQSAEAPGRFVREDGGAVDDARLRRIGLGDFDHIDAEKGRAVVARHFADAAGQPSLRTPAVPEL